MLVRNYWNTFVPHVSLLNRSEVKPFYTKSHHLGSVLCWRLSCPQQAWGERAVWLCSPVTPLVIKRANREAFLKSNNLSADHDRSRGQKGNSKNGNIIVFCLWTNSFWVLESNRGKNSLTMEKQKSRNKNENFLWLMRVSLWNRSTFSCFIFLLSFWNHPTWIKPC